jgi:hypothetical protein
LHISRFIIGACLIIGKWLFLLTGLLAILAVVADYFRGDTGGRPEVMLAIGVIFPALAGVFHYLGQRLEKY